MFMSMYLCICKCVGSLSSCISSVTASILRMCGRGQYFEFFFDNAAADLEMSAHHVKTSSAFFILKEDRNVVLKNASYIGVFFHEIC